MNGTSVTVNEHMEIEAFHSVTAAPSEDHFKTVNIYSLSSATWRLVRQRLDQYISSNMINGYYETVFADMVKEGSLSFTPVFFDTSSWYEIDTITDLRAAELICDTPQHPQSFSIYPSFDSPVAAKDSSNSKVLSPMTPGSTLLQ